jgi:hypothetical protein
MAVEKRDGEISFLPFPSPAACSLPKIAASTRIPLKEAAMKAKALVLTLALSFVGAGSVYGADVFAGTWKLNEAKSKFSPGSPKNSTVVYEAAGDNVKITIDGTDRNGKPAHNEWTGKFDGKDYPVTGDPNSDLRSYTIVNDHTLTVLNKKNGKATVKARIVVSGDGKSRTVTASGKDSSDGKFHSTQAVYDKQ